MAFRRELAGRYAILVCSRYYHDVVFRTGQRPDMKINQFLPGVPHEQWIWIDDLQR